MRERRPWTADMENKGGDRHAVAYTTTGRVITYLEAEYSQQGRTG